MMTFGITREQDVGRDIHVVTLSGELHVAELMEIIVRLNILSEEQPSVDVLLDESDAEASLISQLDIRKIARAWSDSNASKRLRIAVVAPAPVIYGVNRMVQALARSEGRMKVSKTRSEAVAWLLEAGASGPDEMGPSL
jgi:hypothetical protein